METSTKSEVGGRKSEWAGAESEAVLQIRSYEAEADYALIAGWYRGHGKTPVPPWVLPRLGIVIYETDGETSRDLAALWLYMDNSCGVCFLDKVVAAPGLGLCETRRALEFGTEFLRREAVRMNYGVMIVYAYPATARFIRKMGFTECETGMHCLWRLTKEED